MNLLIVKLGAIGDIVHTLPAIAAIRSTFPDASITWAAERRSAEILRDSPVLDNLLEIDTTSFRGGLVIEKMLIEGARQVKELRKFDFEVAIDFQGLLKSGVIAKISGARERWGFPRGILREPAARVFYTHTADVPERSHVIHRNIALAAAALKLEPDTRHIEFPIATNIEHVREADEIISQTSGPFVILNPAGGWVTKLWDTANYGRLADMIWSGLGMSSIIVGGPSDALLTGQAAAASRSTKAIVATPSLKGFYELAKRARLYVGGDTGPTHLAIAAGTPIVGIFGPTEWWRNGSPDPKDICVERLDIDCRVDCHRRTCSNWICMDITPETVFGAVQARLAGNRSPLSTICSS